MDGHAFARSAVPRLCSVRFVTVNVVKCIRARADFAKSAISLVFLHKLTIVEFRLEPKPSYATCILVSNHSWAGGSESDTVLTSVWL